MRAAHLVIPALALGVFVTSRGSAAGTPGSPADTEAAPASAPSDAQARAKALFEQAAELARGGDYAAACGKLEQSLALHEGLGTSFQLASCWQKLGRTASAYLLFRQVAERAHELGQAEREQVARARSEELLPQLSRLRVEWASPPPRAELRRDDVPVPASDWGKPLPLDRGVHELRATADGKQAWSATIDVSEPATVFAVQVPVLADAKPAQPALVPVLKPVTAAPAASKVAAPEAVPPSDGGSRRTLGIVAGSIGVAALAAGILEGAQYLHQNRVAKGLCPTSVNCTTDEITQHTEAVHDARTARTWSYVGVGVGSAALVTGAYLFLTAPHGGQPSAGRARAWELAPFAAGRDGYGATLRGSF